jgi:hypothetical protein
VVSPRGLLRKLSKGLGIGESATGDADFDAAFHVSAAPRGIAAVFLDRAMRAAVMQAETKLEIDDGRLRILVEGHPESAVEKRVFARGLYRGHATSMTLVVDDDGARILVACEGVQLAFDGLEPDPEEVVAALATAVDARTDGYR